MSKLTPKDIDQYRQNLANECLDRSEELTSDDGQHHFELDEHQVDGMLETAVALDKGTEHFSIVHPGGSGKTVIEAGIVQASQAAKEPFNGQFEGTKDLILTVERSLIVNVRDHIASLLNKDVGIWGMGKKELEPNVIVASVQALQKNKANLRKILDPKNVSLVIGDEADKFLTPARKKLLRQFQQAIHIGLTATPEWSDGRHIDDAWGEIVHQLTLKEGIQRKINVPPMYYLYQADVDGDQIAVANGDYDKKSLAAAMKAVEIELAIPKIYESIIPERHRQRFPTLVYVPSVDILQHTTERLQKTYGNQGLKISSWHGEITSSRLSREIKAFQDGEIDILVLCEMGGRGLNLPRARCIIDAYPTLSANKLEQRHARGLRKIRPNTAPYKEGFKKPFAIIAQILPKSNSFRPLTLLDILDCWPDYRLGRVLGLQPRLVGHGLGDGAPITEEVSEIAEHIKSHKPRGSVTLLENVDILHEIKLREELAQIDNEGFIYMDNETGEFMTREEHDKKYV